MAKMKQPQDTETFRFCNANPKGRKTGDCVIRAISAFMGESWETVYRALAEMGIKYGTMLNCPETYVRFLKSRGYEKKPMPRTVCGTKYTGEQFCREIAEPGTCYLVSMANHVTFIGPDCRIHDIWNCGEKCVGNYWARKCK